MISVASVPEAVDGRRPGHHPWGVFSIVLAVLILGMLVIFHEFGHYWVAKRSGMSVSRFSVGFGPVLYETERDGTLFQVAAVPLGGFVQIDGMDPEDELEDPSTGYEAKPFHLKFATILAGPVANYLLGFLLLWFFYVAFAYTPLPPVRVMGVQADSAAAAAGLQVGDELTGVVGQPFTEMDDFTAAIQGCGGAPLAFTLIRDGATLSVPLTPREAGGRYVVGVEFEPVGRQPQDFGLIEAAGVAGAEVMKTSGLLLATIPRLFQPGSGAKVAGPLGIIRSLSERMRRSWSDTIPVVAQLSIMLGLFNLLPIPALDGSRLLFLLIGLVRRRPVSPKVENYVHFAGMMLLLGLFVLITFKDAFSWATD